MGATVETTPFDRGRKDRISWHGVPTRRARVRPAGIEADTRPCVASEGGTRAAAYFEKLYDAFTRAERAAGAIDRHYVIGSLIVRFRFAGPALVSAMTPALAHLATDEIRGADLTICMFDQASTVAAPAPAWGLEDYGPRGEIRGFNSSRIRTVYDAAERALRMADLDHSVAIFCVRDARAVPYYERGAPLRSIFHWMMGAHGRQLVHAAAVGMPSGGVLLAGRSGSGKSTAALACIGSPLRYAGDDYVLIDRGSPPHVYTLYSTAKVHSEQVDRFPHLRALVDNSAHLATEKALIFLERHLPDCLSQGFPVRALLIPRITGGSETQLVRASPAAALAALAPTTVLQLPGEGRRTFETLAALARAVPSHWLDVGTDLRRIPEAIAEALRS
jgi:hypothetical protein